MAQSNGAGNGTGNMKLEIRYPVDSVWELTVDNETCKGRIYCTDEITQTVVLQTALKHTTLASEIRVINAASIAKAQKLKDNGEADAAIPPVTGPLPVVHKKALEERERKAIRMAEENLRNINEKASPKGQQVFDKLLKACSEAVWNGESIIVLKQIQVDPPYGPENCRILQRNAGKKASDDGSLERVMKIVASSS